MWRRAVQDEDSGGEGLAHECEAFLRGEYAGWLQRHGRLVPGWARLNRAAHADLDELRRDVARHGVPAGPSSFEDAAVLIEAIISETTGLEDLRRVQHDLLIPLELELMTNQISPRAAVQRVFEALC